MYEDAETLLQRLPASDKLPARIRTLLLDAAEPFSLPAKASRLSVPLPGLLLLHRGYATWRWHTGDKDVLVLDMLQAGELLYWRPPVWQAGQFVYSQRGCQGYFLDLAPLQSELEACEAWRHSERDLIEQMWCRQTRLRVLQWSGESLQRTARYLLEEQQRRQGEDLWLLPPKRLLAQCIGMTPSTLSRTLAELCTRDILAMHGRRVRLRDSQQLAQLAQLAL